MCFASKNPSFSSFPFSFFSSSTSSFVLTDIVMCSLCCPSIRLCPAFVVTQDIHRPLSSVTLTYIARVHSNIPTTPDKSSSSSSSSSTKRCAALRNTQTCTCKRPGSGRKSTSARSVHRGGLASALGCVITARYTIRGASRSKNHGRCLRCPINTR